MSAAIVSTKIDISEREVRESIAVARSHGEKFFEQIVWQVENEAWRVLGYASWDEMRLGEYDDMGVVAPRADRPELVARMRAKGLTQAQIAGTLGVDRKTVMADLSKSETDIEDSPPVITNARGQERPATYNRTETTKVEESVTADPDTGEILDPPTEQTPPRADRRRSLVDDAFTANTNLWKAVERIREIRNDDRYTRNKADILAALQPSADLATEILADLFNTRKETN